MSFRGIAVGLSLVALIAAGPVGATPAVVPPQGSPDLSQMALQQTDFAKTTVTSEGYTAATAPFIATYQREFGASVSPGGGRYLNVLSEVNLDADAAAGSADFEALRAFLHSKNIRGVILGAIGKRGVKKKNVRLGKVRELAVGDGAALLPIRLRVMGIWFSADAVFFHRDRVIGILLLFGFRIKVADASALATTMVTHINTGLVPQNTSLPAISGTPAQGQTLSAAPGSWTNSPTTFSYQWLRCDASGAACAPIAGQTGTTYTVGSADVGKTLAVSVTATNAVGSSSPAQSQPTAVVH
jgi:hypothetical protein